MTLKTCAPKTTKLRQTDAFRLSLLAALLPVLLPAAQAEAAEGGIAIENCADSAACRLYDGSTNTPDDVYVGGTESNYDYNFKHSAGFTNTSRDQSGQTVYVTDGTGIGGVVRAASALYGRSASGNTLVIDLGGKTRAETKLSLTGVADVKTYDVEDRHTFSSIAAASGEWGEP